MSPHAAIYVDMFPDCVLPAFPSNGNVTCGNLHPEGNEYRLIYGQVSISSNCLSSSLMVWPNKLEGLPLETLSSLVLEFEGKVRANPIGGPFKCFLLG